MKVLIPASALLLILAGCDSFPPPKDAAQAPQPQAGAQPAALGAAAQKLDGDWQSVDDPKNVVKIKGDTFTDVYDGKVSGTQKIRYVRSCTDKAQVQASEFFLLVSASGELCYQLLAVTADNLSYSYVERGNTLSYKRLK